MTDRIQGRAPAIRDFLLQAVQEHPKNLAKVAAEHFAVSRVTINRNIKLLMKDGLLLAGGKTKDRHYWLATVAGQVVTVDVTPELSESDVWRAQFAGLLKGLPENIRDICQHGFTEMLNNVIDHSESPRTFLSLKRTAVGVKLIVGDDGLGIFNKLQRDFGLDDPRHALLELSKGKLSTDESRHSGEGIFFTSRMFDKFTINSGTLFFGRINKEDDWLIESRDEPPRNGTWIHMDISTRATQTVKQVCDEFSAERESFGFTRTHVPVRLAQYEGEKLISRSQAKRLLARFYKFKEVTLDFKGVEMIGQAFADEIFRVYKREHPNVEIRWLYANEDVARAILKVQAAAAMETSSNGVSA